MSFQYPECTPVYISTATTTIINKNPRCILHTLVFNAATTGTVLIYDGPAANLQLVYSFSTAQPAGSIQLNTSFGNGIYIVTSAADKITANWTT